MDKTETQQVSDKLATYKLEPGRSYTFYLSNGHELHAILSKENLNTNHLFRGDELIFVTVHGAGPVGKAEAQTLNWNQVVGWKLAH